MSYPIGSMYGIFTYIYHKNQPNVGKYTIHGSCGYCIMYAYYSALCALPNSGPNCTCTVEYLLSLEDLLGSTSDIRTRTMLVNDNSFLNASKMTECQKRETTKTVLSLWNLRVFRIGAVQVAHWDHGPKKTFRSMEQSYC